MNHDNPEEPPVPPKSNLRIGSVRVGKPFYGFPVINKINRLLNQSIVDYNNQLIEYSGEFENEKELIEANEYLLKQIINDFKEETQIDDNNFLGDFVNKLKEETKLILNNFIQTNFKGSVISKTSAVEEGPYDLPRCPTSVQVMEYPNENIYEAINECLIQNVKPENGEKSCEGQTDYEIYDDYEISTDSSDNETYEKSVSPDFHSYKTLYLSRLENSIKPPIDENSINERHRELRSEFIEMFRLKENGSDVEMLSQYLDQSFYDFKIKTFKIRKQMQNCFKEGKRIYTQEMEAYRQRGAYYSETKISEINECLKVKAINTMKKRFEIIGKHKETDLKEWTQELTKDMEQELQRYKQYNAGLKLKSDKELAEKVKEFCDKYDNDITNLIETVESQEQLKRENNTLISQFVDKFKNLNDDTEILTTHLDELNKGMEKTFEMAKKLLDIRLEKDLLERQRNAGIIREVYKQKMQNKFEIKNFYFKSNFIDIHKNIVSEMANRYSQSQDFVIETVQDIYSEFEDLNARNTPTIPAIGIDLGTTNSCVAYFTPNLKLTKNTAVIVNELGKEVTPSVVSFRKDNEILVGDVAKEEMGNRIEYSKNTIHSVKRLIGLNFDDLRRSRVNHQFIANLEYSLNNRGNKPIISTKVDGFDSHYFPEQISAEILKKMKEIAEKYLEGFDVKKVVITVPAYFNESQKEATRQAGTLAGLEVLGIINEPIAAAIAFKMDRNIEVKDKTILIFDFGGGTLDVAIVELKKGEIITKAVKGDNYLGGEDIDTNLIDYCLLEFSSQTGLTLNRRQLNIHRLRRVCESAKIKLSVSNATLLYLNNFYQDHDLNIEITRSKFNEINKLVFNKAINLVKETLKEAKLKERDIDDIVLVGGSTRIPRITEMLSKLFHNRALNHTINPELSVAVGAAIHAAILNGQSSLEKMYQFKDVTPMSYGVERYSNKEMFVLIPRNTKLPAKATSKFNTHEDNQESVSIRVYEGDDKIAQNNHLLGEFTLNGIPPGKKGSVKVKVTFEIKEDGILRVSAECDKVVGNLDIKEHKSRLTEEELQRLIEKSKYECLKDKKIGPDNTNSPGAFEWLKNRVQQPVNNLFYKNEHA